MTLRIELYDFDVHGSRGPAHEAIGWKVRYRLDGLTLDGSLWVDLPIGRVDICDAIEKAIDQPTLSAMRPDERVAYFRSVSAGYCDRCGDVLDGVCHCENDE